MLLCLKVDLPPVRQSRTLEGVNNLKNTCNEIYSQFAAHIVLIAIGYILFAGGRDVQVLCV